jgi:hypothetical protein
MLEHMDKRLHEATHTLLRALAPAKLLVHLLERPPDFLPEGNCIFSSRCFKFKAPPPCSREYTAYTCIPIGLLLLHSSLSGGRV